MPIILDLQKPHDLPGLASRTVLAHDYDNAPLPLEVDPSDLERTAKLQKLNDELETFSWSVSHDIKAPLSQISAYLFLLKGHAGGNLDDVAQEYLAGIKNCIDRISRLTEDLLRLAGVARAEFVRQRVDLSRMAWEIAADLSARAPARRAEWLISPGLEADGDAGLIEILLNNLLSNAWKYTTRCPLARIEFGVVLETDGVLQYHVRDNGAGFDMASAGRLFQPFERLHTRAEFPGTGVGLATVRRIIERHGGRIWAEGEVGRGAIFRFTLA